MTDELTPELREAVERDYQRWHRTDSPTFRVLLTEWALRVQRAEARIWWYERQTVAVREVVPPEQAQRITDLEADLAAARHDFEAAELARARAEAKWSEATLAWSRELNRADNAEFERDELSKKIRELGAQLREAEQDFEDEHARFKKRGGEMDRLQGERDTARGDFERAKLARLKLVDELAAVEEAHATANNTNAELLEKLAEAEANTREWMRMQRQAADEVVDQLAELSKVTFERDEAWRELADFHNAFHGSEEALERQLAEARREAEHERSRVKLSVVYPNRPTVFSWESAPPSEKEER